MHNKDKYPEIWATMQKADAELVPLLFYREEHTDKMAEVQLKINDLIEGKERHNAAAMKDAARIAELRSVISRCAIAMGAIRTGQ